MSEYCSVQAYIQTNDGEQVLNQFKFKDNTYIENYNKKDDWDKLLEGAKLAPENFQDAAECESDFNKQLRDNVTLASLQMAIERLQAKLESKNWKSECSESSYALKRRKISGFQTMFDILFESAGGKLETTIKTACRKYKKFLIEDDRYKQAKLIVEQEEEKGLKRFQDENGLASKTEIAELTAKLETAKAEKDHEVAELAAKLADLEMKINDKNYEINDLRKKFSRLDEQLEEMRSNAGLVTVESDNSCNGLVSVIEVGRGFLRGFC